MALRKPFSSLMARDSKTYKVTEQVTQAIGSGLSRYRGGIFLYFIVKVVYIEEISNDRNDCPGILIRAHRMEFEFTTTADHKRSRIVDGHRPTVF